MYGLFLICAFITSGCCELSLGEVSSPESKNTTCSEIGDCPTKDADCKELCGCDKNIPTKFDNKTQECVINLTLLIESLKEKYNSEDNGMSAADDGIATKLEAEADRIFQGVIVAAFLFIACASTCLIVACIYCCRINYTDHQLKKNIKVLAKQVGKKSQMKKPAKAPTEPMAESCNVIVEDAGVFCV